MLSCSVNKQRPLCLLTSEGGVQTYPTVQDNVDTLLTDKLSSDGRWHKEANICNISLCHAWAHTDRQNAEFQSYLGIVASDPFFDESSITD